MFMVAQRKIRSWERGLLFRDGEFVSLLGEGRHWFFDPMNRLRLDLVSQRDPWLRHDELDLLIRSRRLDGELEVLDLKDQERALVWVDGRFDRIVGGGLHALWTGFRDLRIELRDIRDFRFDHGDLDQIMASAGADRFLEIVTVEDEEEGVLFRDGRGQEVLAPGRHAFWKGTSKVQVYRLSRRECPLDLGGQEIMTADKVSLRINATVFYRVIDARRAICAVGDVFQAMYREAQLALRAVVGQRSLDLFLEKKDEVEAALLAAMAKRAAALGVEVTNLGIKDLILPGDMKAILNRVTEAKKAAEANLITRREETAAMRSQANTARLLEANPMLLRLRELEALERVAGTSELKLVLGEKGLADRIVNLI